MPQFRLNSLPVHHRGLLIGAASLVALLIVISSAWIWTALHQEPVLEEVATTDIAEPEVAGATSSGPKITPTRTLYVSPKGANESGRGTKAAPFQTIQYALEQAKPGTAITVLPGTYREPLHSVRNGSKGKPIVLQASGKVKLMGNEKNGRIFELKHDYHHILGFEFAGSDILLWMQEADNNRIAGNYFHHAQGECVRLKYHSTNNVIERNRVAYCGLEDYGGGGDGKNGEGVYLGTAPEQLSKNPTQETDKTNNNIVRYNKFDTRGNECVDIKEGSERNVIEFNNCTGQQDVESGGFDSRGNRNIFRYNRIYGNKGAGIRFGGDSASDGLHNEAYGNEIKGNAREAIKIMRPAQGKICGNAVQGNIRGLSNQKNLANASCATPLPSPGVK